MGSRSESAPALGSTVTSCCRARRGRGPAQRLAVTGFFETSDARWVGLWNCGRSASRQARILIVELNFHLHEAYQFDEMRLDRKDEAGMVRIENCFRSRIEHPVFHLSAQEPDDTPDARLMTEKEVADQLQISSRTLRKFRTNGNLPFVRFGRAIRYTPEDIRSFISQMTRANDNPPPIRTRRAAVSRRAPKLVPFSVRKAN